MAAGISSTSGDTPAGTGNYFTLTSTLVIDANKKTFTVTNTASVPGTCCLSDANSVTAGDTIDYIANTYVLSGTYTGLDGDADKLSALVFEPTTDSTYVIPDAPRCR